MGEAHATYELKEPASPEPLLPHEYSVAGWFAAAFLTLVLVSAWLVWRRRRHTPGHPRDVRLLAYQEATCALEKITAVQAREAAVQASLILRQYLALAAHDPALFETHEEFISRQDALKALSESARAACATGFAQLAALKYAPQDPDMAATAVVSTARGLLDKLHHGFHD